MDATAVWKKLAEKDACTSLLESWLDQHQRIINNVIRSYSDAAFDEDDLFQEICVQLWKSIPSFRQQCKPSTWIYRVAIFTAISFRRSNKRRGDNPTFDELTHHPIKPVHANGEKEQQLTWLYSQIHRFNLIDRSLLILSLEGYGYADIAEILGITVSNVGAKLHRIKASLSEKQRSEQP